MVFFNDRKLACVTCIKGHRSSTCTHTSRPLFEIKKKGRPVTQCDHCRQLRKTRQVHVKCLCDSKTDDGDGTHAKRAPTPAFPNGLQELPLAPATLAPSTSSTVVAPAGPPCTCNSSGECKCCTPYKPRSKRTTAAAPRADSTTLTLTKNPGPPLQNTAVAVPQEAPSMSPTTEVQQFIPHTRPPSISTMSVSPRPGHSLTHGHAHPHAHHGANSFQPYPHPVAKQHVTPTTERNPYDVFGTAVSISPYQSIEATLLPSANGQGPSGLPAVPEYQTLPQTSGSVPVVGLPYPQADPYATSIPPSTDTPSPDSSNSGGVSGFLESYMQDETISYDPTQNVAAPMLPIGVSSYDEFFDLANSMLALPSSDPTSPMQMSPTYAMSDCSVDDVERAQNMYGVLTTPANKCAGGCGCFEGSCNCGLNCQSTCGHNSNIGSTVSLANDDGCCVNVWEPYFNTDANANAATLTYPTTLPTTSEQYLNPVPMKEEASLPTVPELSSPPPSEYQMDYVARRPPSLMSTSSSGGSRASTPPLTLSSCASSIRTSSTGRSNPIKSGFRRILPKVMKGSDGAMSFKSRLPRVDSLPEPEPDSIMAYLKPSPGPAIASYDPWTLPTASDPASQFRERSFPMPLFPRSHF